MVKLPVKLWVISPAAIPLIVYGTVVLSATLNVCIVYITELPSSTDVALALKWYKASDAVISVPININFKPLPAVELPTWSISTVISSSLDKKGFFKL